MEMETLEFLEEQELINHIDWEHLFDDVPDTFDLLDAPVFAASNRDQDPISTKASSEMGNSWIGQIEHLLMKDFDGENDARVITDSNHSHQFCDDNILEHILLDSPAECQLSASNRERVDSSSDEKNSSLSPDSNHSNVKTANTSADDKEDDNNDNSDPKKRKRQLRNRDAAMRSRERKKMYVRDLEAKSRYLEAECRRLGRLLQCCFAENQMLRFSLHSGSVLGAPMTKPESAVLLLESLLLGSLVWLMGITCLLPLPRLLLLIQDVVILGSVNNVSLESVAPREIRSELVEKWVPLTFLKSKRCRGSRIKMKFDFVLVVVSV